MNKKVFMITGSRAEWGILRPLYQELERLGVQVMLVVTGSHLHAGSGFSVAEIEADIGPRFLSVYITPEDESLPEKTLMFASMAAAIEKFASFFENEKPDLVLYYGDRYEIYAAATACRLSGIRSAHVSGGEVSLGAFDDVLRHCITKLSDLHFTATEEFRRRVVQLGENPNLVYNTGELALADLDKTAFLSQEQLEKDLNCSLNEFFLITLHPETCAPGTVLKGLATVLSVLRELHPDTTLLFTGANADPEGNAINAALAEEARRQPDTIVFHNNLGRLRYLSAARLARCVIGNSSSGIIELPSLGIPVLNLGNRQGGRPRSQAVITADFSRQSVKKALKKLLAPDWREKCRLFPNPYEGIDAARTIAGIIAGYDINSISSEKKFYDLTRSRRNKDALRE
jgi:UDP-hydrolysing UDP-N-acetyl-D-glucosamine 2-epimerase